MEVLPGVHLLPRALGCNVYYLADPEVPVLIDAGLPLSGRRMVRALSAMNPAWPQPRHLLLTHYHVDHAGAAAEVRRLTGAAVTTHPAEAEAFARRQRSGTARTPWRARLYTAGLQADVLVEDGEVLPVLDGLEVLHTPGHTPGSLCFYLREHKALFTGDLFVSHEDQLSKPFLGPESDRDAYDASLQRVSELGPKVLLPGHGYTVLNDASRLLREMIASGGAPPPLRTRIRNLGRPSQRS